MTNDLQDALVAGIGVLGASVPLVVRAAEWISSRWLHKRTLDVADAPPLPRPLFGCFCDECQAAMAGLRLAEEQAAAPEPLPPHLGTYRTNPRPQPTLPRKAPWWRLALWWAKGGPRRLKRRRAARAVARIRMIGGGALGNHVFLSADASMRPSVLRLYDTDGRTSLATFAWLTNDYEIHGHDAVRCVDSKSIAWEIAQRDIDQ